MKLLNKKFFMATLITFFAFAAPISSGNATSHKPTLAQIEAAKKAELTKKKIADEALKKLGRAKGD